MCIENSHEAEYLVEQRYAPTSYRSPHWLTLPVMLETVAIAMSFTFPYYLFPLLFPGYISTLRPHVGQLALM